MITEQEFRKAAFGGDPATVKLYVEQGGAINGVNAKGMSPLMLAAWGGHGDIVRLLLEHGADMSIRQGSSGWRALTYAAVNGFEDALAALLGHGDTFDPVVDWKALLFAVEYRNTTTARMLIEHGADPNLRDEEGLTPLMRAARKSDPVGVAMLLEHGADPNLADGQGLTALMYAAGKANVENIRALLDAGADPAARSHAGETALIVADGARRTKIVAELRAAETGGRGR
jgi:ankyrin repeat protein